MNKETRDQWIAALRSGRFQQGHGALHPTPETYCCLGVLCEITPGGSWVERGRPGDWYYHHNGKLASSAYPPASLCKEVGLDHYAGSTLATMNDLLKRTFTEIAEWIEQNL